MRVLFLTNIPAPYRVEFFEQLGKKCDLTVLYELHNATNRNAKWGDGSEHTLTYREVFLHCYRTIYDGGIAPNVFGFLSGEYDIIIVGTHGTPTAKMAMLYMRFRHIPYVLNIDGMLSAELSEKSIVNRYLRSLLFRGAEAYVVSGQDTITYLQNLRVQLAQVYVYPFSSINDVDILSNKVDQTAKAALRRECNIDTQRNIIAVGRFVTSKGFEALFHFMRKAPKDVGLILIGGDSDVYQVEISKLSQDVQNRIYFPGFLNKAQLAKYYKLSDVFVLPTHHDAWGLVVNEALAYGLPVITTDRCGAGLEMIKEGINGYVIHHMGEDNLRVRLDELLNTPELCEQMSNANIGLAHQYTIEKMAEKHIEIFSEILSKRQ